MLGSLVGQLDPVDVRELRVTCTGEAGELGVTPIARAALAGFLEHHLEEPVNPISAPYEAQERGIRLAEVKEPSDRYATTVRVTVTGEKGIHTATGTPGRKGEPRLVGLEGYEIDAVMEGPIVIIRNEDRPGVIGSVGTLLGNRGINVSRMQVGLDEDGRPGIGGLERRFHRRQRCPRRAPRHRVRQQCAYPEALRCPLRRESDGPGAMRGSGRRVLACR